MKLLEVEGRGGGHVPQCPVAGDATAFNLLQIGDGVHWACTVWGRMKLIMIDAGVKINSTY